MEKTNTIFVVGMGPGGENGMTTEAFCALEQSDVIVGYTVYVDLLRARFAGKTFLTTPMRQELARCRLCFDTARQGKRVALVCSGDAGVYGLASPMLLLAREYPDCEVAVIPGVTAALSGAAALGAPLNHDFCVISLSDLLTPWERIEKRLIAAAEGDFAIALYNPASRRRSDYLQRACDILLAHGASAERACGLAENIGRDGMRTQTLTLGALRNAEANMFTTVFIGNSQSVIEGGKLITARGYRL